MVPVSIPRRAQGGALKKALAIAALLVLAFFVVPLPACLHISAQTTPTTPENPPKPLAKVIDPAPPRLEFASLPRVPGTVVRTRPDANPTVNANANGAQNANTQANNTPKPIIPSTQTTTTAATSPIFFCIAQLSPVRLFGGTPQETISILDRARVTYSCSPRCSPDFPQPAAAR